ncbi:zinc-ribbon-domain-containing protein [Glomus cerebriforme]|uniref:Zinc-ribbon-domain-containing protein n=1 Tax=Glomus cerebriforme TaxID=658196 RepID=A0A397TE04_9GLOM|nr:zinc-ribbon-domain-containing protein [Glomus cerebriforme]
MFDNEEWIEFEAEEENENEDGEFITRNGQQSSQTPQVDLQIQNDLRKVILGIQNDLSIKQEEKAHIIQNLMTSKWRQFEKKPASGTNKYSEPTEEDLKPTYNENSQTLGCKHYRRGAKLQSNCCNRWFTCRFCHDDACDHQIDRHATKNMMCMYCQTIQPVNKSCNKCERELARYYCDKCKFWDDKPDKHIYHCDSCKICRVGRGLGIDYFHCDVCDCCLQIRLKDSHRCIEKNLERDCVICGEYLFTSISQAIFMPCGHSMHNNCYNEYVTTAYQCPTCWKSIGNMDLYFRRIDAIVAQQKMPPEYDNFFAHILCNDCEKRSTVKYHFLYHKCPYCQSYNTKVLETKEKLPSEEELSEESTNSSSSNNNSAAAGPSSSNTNVISNSNNNNIGVGGNGVSINTTTNGGGSSGSGAQVRQSRVMEVTAMMQGEEGPTDDGNATEHRTRNPLNSLESNHYIN